MTPPGEADLPPGELIYRGAEADVVRGSWCGLDAVYKVRKPLPYRLKELDDEIRRQRTAREAEMVAAARAAGVESPFLYYVDLPRSTLVEEFVEGERLKDLVSALPPRESAPLFRLLGADAARLHAAGIMHGDLTTANVVRRGRGLVFLDFGLALHSARTEDHAVDLRLIKETIYGAHSAVAARAMAALREGYAGVAGEPRARAVFRQLVAVERRGRYARVD